MSCGCCLDACPQYEKIELEQREGESDAEFHRRKNESYDEAFIGAHAISQVRIPLTTSIAQAGRAATWHGIKSWFDR
jgi:succinate dehydrogenase / fumarate reductase iron-sulfur subunit